MKKMRLLSNTVLFFCILLAVGCTQHWEEYYNDYPETVNENVWNAMQSDPEISRFIQVLTDHELDTLFNSDIPYTVFTPSNEAMGAFPDSIYKTLLMYHICSHVLNSGSIQGKRKIQTLTEKFALFERLGNSISFDEVEIASESPLYRNGKYYLVNEVIAPKPNLYEYFVLTNPILSDYIDSQDSIILDRERSTPIGFDENGNTIYDTVAEVFNVFEYEYFPVKHEFRDLAATIVFPKQEDYNAALNVMADALGPQYIDYSDIPLEWQNDVLVPQLLEQGIFLNMLEPEEFYRQSEEDVLRLMNILGDSIVIDYTPVEKTLCSNGYAYNYQDYQIPSSLYSGGSRIEAEVFTALTGINKYAWIEGVIVRQTIPLAPEQEFINSASEDTIIKVRFPNGYSDEFSVEIGSYKLFPRKYVMEVRTHMNIGGIYEIYVNDELVKTFDYEAFKDPVYQGIIESVIKDEYYFPKGLFNSFDMYVENIIDFSSTRIRFEYKGPGTNSSNGFVLDYIEFRPVD
ncbi:fasciclin domain-containing protein [Bacteroidota bacterium]